jgi:hypothetical protein
MTLSAAYESSASISTSEYSMPAATTTGVPTSQTADGIYQLFLDLNALAAGDQFELKIYEKVQSGGTQRLLDSALFVGVQSKPNFVMPSLILLHGWDMTLKKIAGTDRTIGWSIRAVT